MVLGSSPICSQGLLLCCSLLGCREERQGNVSRDGAVASFEGLWMLLGCYPELLSGAFALVPFLAVNTKMQGVLVRVCIAHDTDFRFLLHMNVHGADAGLQSQVRVLVLKFGGMW